ncbi:hypothetical protein CKAN_02731400 [Cinnamomum micranthum f. kanehirae]|uniref:Uncharacterized protein n=1 Tax=Cinnamomum micranthum f. kanehirae TaxID=337451 RepID=A0A443Q4A4_9MAGN|nr:hypothetical protein CKAN_02731400 [Cinnamomum micranthum f. kanehirae]
MMMNEMKINEEEGVQRCSGKGRDKRENEEEEEEDDDDDEEKRNETTAVVEPKEEDESISSEAAPPQTCPSIPRSNSPLWPSSPSLAHPSGPRLPFSLSPHSLTLTSPPFPHLPHHLHSLIGIISITTHADLTLSINARRSLPPSPSLLISKTHLKKPISVIRRAQTHPTEEKWCPLFRSSSPSRSPHPLPPSQKKNPSQKTHLCYAPALISLAHPSLALVSLFPSHLISITQLSPSPTISKKTLLCYTRRRPISPFSCHLLQTSTSLQLYIKKNRSSSVSPSPSVKIRRTSSRAISQRGSIAPAQISSRASSVVHWTIRTALFSLDWQRTRNASIFSSFSELLSPRLVPLFSLSLPSQG